jgi:Predicted membrane protein
MLLLTRILGNKQMSQLTFFNYITGITIGSIAGNMISAHGEPFWEELIGLASWCIFTILIAYISMKFPKIRVLLDGEPTILIKNGVIQRHKLKLLHINLDDLSMLLRQQEAFSLNEVSYAILEPDGKLSILKKPEYQTPNKKDLNVKITPPKYIPSEIIVDGKIINKNLEELGLTMTWLRKELKTKGYNSADQIFYAEIQSDGSLFIFDFE